MMTTQCIEGQYVDLLQREIYPARIRFCQGKTLAIERVQAAPQNYILPGFIDGHVHIESAMVSPGRFAEAAVKHGTTGVVADPHEMANVLGIPGVEYMIRDGKRVPFHFFFGAPSCVPATPMETSGAQLNARAVHELLQKKEVFFLSEMMNFPAVLSGDAEVREKMEWARREGKPVDGHAPGLGGEQLRRYIASGISTDHESETLEEATEKLEKGMYIQIREGSAARSFENLHTLMNSYPSRLMFCSDDIHPEMLQQRHIKSLVVRGIRKGYPLFDLLRIACLNPLRHYAPEVPWTQVGGPASWIITGDLKEFPVLETWVKGQKVYDGTNTLFHYMPESAVNNFNAQAVSEEQLAIKNQGKHFKAIVVQEGSLVTSSRRCAPVKGEFLLPDPENDLLLLSVKDRYKDKPPVSAIVSGFGLRKGSIASSVAHDSHNVLGVGTSHEALAKTMNRVIESRGGMAVFDGECLYHMDLPLAGLMSLDNVETVAGKYLALNDRAKMLGSNLSAPFMTLSFMSLLVIPELKLGDRGLFDVGKFEFVEMFEQFR